VRVRHVRPVPTSPASSTGCARRSDGAVEAREATAPVVTNLQHIGHRFALAQAGHSGHPAGMRLWHHVKETAVESSGSVHVPASAWEHIATSGPAPVIRAMRAADVVDAPRQVA
jgi:hypothetical protein